MTAKDKPNQTPPTTDSKPKRRSVVYIVQCEVSISIIDENKNPIETPPKFIDFARFENRSDADAWIMNKGQTGETYRIVKLIGPMLQVVEKTTSQIMVVGE